MKNNSMTKKLVATFLSLTLIFPIVFSGELLYAQDNGLAISSVENKYDKFVNACENSYWGKQVKLYGQNRNIGTAAIKKALKWALHHKREIIKGAEKWIGKEAAAEVSKVIYDISPTLHKLLEYEDLVWQTVQDQLVHVVGRRAAFWIAKVIEWIAPF